MRRWYAVLGWGVVALGVVHMASTPGVEAPRVAVWFLAGGIAMVLTGALNLLNRAYGAVAPGLRRFCVGNNVAMTAFAVVAGLAGGAGPAQMVVVVGWMAATAALSLLPEARRAPGRAEAP